MALPCYNRLFARTLLYIVDEIEHEHIGWEEDANLMSVSNLRRLPAKPWKKRTEPPMHTWLDAELPEEQKERLTCLGNIVMPAVANLAAQLFAHSFKQD